MVRIARLNMLSMNSLFLRSFQFLSMSFKGQNFSFFFLLVPLDVDLSNQKVAMIECTVSYLFLMIRPIIISVFMSFPLSIV